MRELRFLFEAFEIGLLVGGLLAGVVVLGGVLWAYFRRRWRASVEGDGPLADTAGSPSDGSSPADNRRTRGARPLSLWIKLALGLPLQALLTPFLVLSSFWCGPEYEEMAGLGPFFETCRMIAPSVALVMLVNALLMQRSFRRKRMAFGAGFLTVAVVFLLNVIRVNLLPVIISNTNR